MKLSVVTTLYNSGRYIEEFYTRVSRCAANLCSDFEIIFVDDGSPDNSLEIAINISKDDPKVSIVELSRNHGHHRAMMIGLEQAIGDLVFLIDVDLEESPDHLPIFWSALHADSEIDVVYGVQKEKRTPPFRKMLSKSFYTIFNYLSSVKIRSDSLVSRLMKRRYVDTLLTYNEREIFLPAIWEDAGYTQVAIELDKSFDGNSNYTLMKRVKLSINAITSFSSKPLASIFYLGVIVSFFSAVFVFYLIFRHFYLGLAVPGWASIVASVYLMGGLIIFSIGVIGAYLAKIFVEVKRRPNSSIRNFHGVSNDK